MKYNPTKEELKLIEIIINIWKNKFKIILICSLFLTIVFFVADYFKKPNQFEIKTNIRKISFSQQNNYALINGFLRMTKSNENIGILNQSMQFTSTQDLNFELTGEYLREVFVKNLKEKRFYPDIIEEFLKNNQNENDRNINFNLALQQLNSSINIYEENDGTEIIIKAKYHDVKKWEKLLNLLEKTINKEVKEIISDRFENYTDNRKELNDLIVKNINNQISFYETQIRETAKKNLIFLFEHLEKSKQLNIEKRSPKITLENFNDNFNDDEFSIIINDYENPKYYLLGYLFIQDQIEMIERSLKNNSLISQDSIRLKASRNFLLNNETHKIIQQLYNKTPLVAENEKFVAASFDVQNSKVILVESGYTKSKILIFAFIFSLLVSMIYVVVYDSLNRKLRFISKKLTN